MEIIDIGTWIADLWKVMTTQSCRERLNPTRAAFTIAEALVALAIIGIGIASFIAGMSQLNKEASDSRNITGAGAIIQNQIDLILSDGPFNPQKTNADGSPQIPPELVLGTHITNNVAIYQEPTTGIIVSGTLTTTVSDISQWVAGVQLPMYQATVSVSYLYKGRTYTATRCTLRASDI